MNNLLQNEFSEADLEKILRTLPRHTVSKRCDEQFYARLKTIVKEERSQRRAWFTLPQFAFASSFAVLMFVASGTLYAYQDSVTRGDLLYPWKQTGERVELAFATTPEKEVDTQLRFSDRRLSEAEIIVGHPIGTLSFVPTAYAANDNLDPQVALHLALTLQDMRTAINEASRIVETNSMEPEAMHTALNKLAVATERHVEQLKKIESRSNEDVVEVIHEMVQEEVRSHGMVVAAQTVVKDGIAKREKRLIIRLTANPDDLTVQRNEARQTYEKAIRLLDQLPAERRAPLQEQITTAKNALDRDNLGLSLGVTRSVQRHIITDDDGLRKEVMGVPRVNNLSTPKPTNAQNVVTPVVPQVQPQSIPAPAAVIPVVNPTPKPIAPINGQMPVGLPR